jgi:hypothetical protein
MSDSARHLAAWPAWRHHNGPNMMMMQQILIRSRHALLALAALAWLAQSPVRAAAAQPIDGDLTTSTAPASAASATAPAPAPAAPAPAPTQGTEPAPGVNVGTGEHLPYDIDVSGAATPATPPVAADTSTTYHKDDLIGAAEGVFGKGAAGLAGMIEDLLRKQGEPNGYIVGREGGGALVFGLRYGSGTLHHKIEGEKPVYWTGPSIGFDAGANAASAFVLVYNLFDTEDLYKRFGAGEGQAYLVGGFHVSYMRRGNIVLVPVRAGAGLRLGINAGYMKFSHKQNWLPF